MAFKAIFELTRGYSRNIKGEHNEALRFTNNGKLIGVMVDLNSSKGVECRMA